MRSMARRALFAICFLFCLTVAAEAVQYNADYIAVVNTCYDSERIYPGSMKNEGEMTTSVSDIYTDEETGKTYQILSARFEELIPLEDAPRDVFPTAPVMGASYAAGDTKTIVDSYNDEEKNVRCLYVGSYCTVWGSTDENAAITLTAQQAKTIGEKFDEHCADMIEAFGDWFDADCDGKVAIFCHDIESTYGKSYSSYTAGYFHMANMLDPEGRINGIAFSTSKYALNMDCIHVDTYPTMGTSIDKISKIYSTLFHEFQHMIAASYCVSTGTYRASLPIYLDEAWSMAAEHMIMGPESINRITYFNDSTRYVTGSPLTYWNDSLSGYSNSYLFGQYVRTRYAQMEGTDGNEVFREVLETAFELQLDGTQVIAQILETTPEQLIKDFWSAVFCRQASGVHGFNGEPWAEKINPVVYDAWPSGGVGSIYNGGVKYVRLNGNPVTIVSKENTDVVCFKNNAVVDGETDERTKYFTVPDDVKLSFEDSSYPWADTGSRLASTNKSRGGSNSSFTVRFTTTKDGTLSFDYGVSSEVNDKLSIYVDGAAVVDGIGGVKTGSYSGALPAGKHEITFTYSKSYFTNREKDCGWMRNFKVEYNQAPEVQKFAIDGANMTLGNELSVNILCSKSKLTDGTYTAYITYNGETMERTFSSYNSTYSCVSFKVAAKEMSDPISVQIVDEDGNVVSLPYETSVRTYGMNLLNNAAMSNKVKTVVVDMLNYGADAQTYFGYHTEDLANALLTDAQKALATEEVQCENYQVKSADFVGSNLTLGERIVLNMFFKNVKSTMYAEIGYTDYTGKAQSFHVPFSEFETSGTMHKIVIDQIVLADSFRTVTVTVYNADGSVFASATDSVESYLARNPSLALGSSIMKFAHSSKIYLGG